MAISLVASSALSAGSSNGGSVTHTFPAGVLQNDVVLVFGACATSITMNTAGYTQLATTSNTNNVATVWMKAMGATPDTSVQVTGSGNALHRTQSSMFILRGADPGTIDVSASATGNSADPNPPSVTTRFANDWTVVFASSPVNDITITAPTNYTNLTVAGGTDASTGGLSMTAAGATRLIATASVEDPAAFGTWTTGTWCAFTIGVREWQQNLYWIGGTGTWDNSSSTNWSTTSGGSGGGGIPGPRTNVFFNASSGSGSWTATVSTGAACEDLSFSSLTGTMTLAGSAGLLIGGDVTMTTTNFVNSYTGTITFDCPGTADINTGGVTLASNLIWDTVDAQTPTYVLSNNLTTTGTSTFNLGTLSLVSYNYTTATFSSNNSNTRTLNFGTGKMVLTSASATTIWDTSTVTGWTTSGTPLVETTGGGANTKTINTGALSEANSISFSILNSAGTVAFTASNTVRNLTINASGTTISNIALTIYGDYTYTAGTLSAGANAWTFNGTSGTDTITASGTTHDFPIVFNSPGATNALAANFTVGATRTVTLTAGTLALGAFTLSTGFFSSNNANTRSVTRSTGKVVITGETAATVVDITTLTGFTTTGNPLFEITGSAAVTKTLSLGAPTAANAFDISLLTTGGTIAFTASNAVNTLIVNASGTTISNVAITIYGNYTYTAGTLTGGTNTWTFSGTTTQTITNGTFDFPITLSGTGTYSIVTQMTVGQTATRALTLTTGTLSLGSAVVSCSIFSSTGTGVRSINFGTGKIVLTATSASTVWDTGTITNLTVSGTPLVEVTGSTANAKTINSGALNEANSISFSLLGTGGHTVAFTASNTVRSLIVNGTFTLSNIAITIFGDYTYTAGTISAGTNAWTFAGTGTELINTGGTIHDFPITFNGTGGTFTLTSNLTNITAGTTTKLVTLTAGTLNLSTFTLTCGQFSSSGSSARTIAFGTGKIVVNTQATATVWDTSTITNLTVTGSKTVELTGSTAAITRTVNSGTLNEANAFNFSILTTSSTVTFTASNTVDNLTINGSGTTITNIALTIYGNYTYTAGTLGAGANAWTFAGTGTSTVNSGSTTHDFPMTISGPTFQLLTSGLTLGSTRLLTLSSGTLDLNNLALSTGSFTVSGGTLGTNINTISVTTLTTYTGGTYNTNGTQTHAAFTQNGAATSIDLTNSTAFSVTGTYTLTAGTLSLAGKTLPVGQFSSNNTNARTINWSTGKFSINSLTTATIWDTGTITGLTVSGTEVVDVIGNSAVTRTINSGALSEANSINFNILTSAGTVTFTASNTVNDLTINASGTTISNIAVTIFGNYTYTAGTISAGTNAWTFASTDSVTVNTAGTIHDFPITFNGTGGTFNLGSNLTNITAGTTTKLVTLTAGTLNLSTFTLTCGQFNSSGSSARTLAFGTGKIVVNTQATATIWDTSTITNLTVSGTRTVEFTGSTAAITRTINSGTLGEGNAFNFSILTTSSTVTFTAGNTIQNLTINAAGTTITNIALTIYGSYTFTAGTLGAGTSAWTFAATSATQTINSGGITHDFPITFNGVGGTWTLTTNGLTVGATRTTTLTNGTLALGSLNLSTGIFSSSNSNTRSITSTGGQISVTFATTATVFDTTTITGLTTSGNPQVNVVSSGTTITRTISTGAPTEANSFSFALTGSATTSTVTFTASNAIYNLTINTTGVTVTNVALTIYNNYTYTAGTMGAGTNAWTFAGSTASTINASGTTHDFPITFNGTGSWTLGSNFTIGATRTTTLTSGTVALSTFTLSTGIFSSSNSNTRSITSTGGQISVTFATTATVFDTTTITGLTTTGNPLVNIVSSGTTITRTISAGTLNETNAFSFSLTGSATTSVVTFTANNTMDNLTINTTGVTMTNVALTIYGNYTYTAGTLGAGTNAWTLAGVSATTFNSGGVTHDFPIIVANTGAGSVTLSSSLVMGTTRTLTLTSGTFNSSTFAVNVGLFSSTGTTTRTLNMGSGNWTLSGVGTVWDTTTTGLTFTKGTSDITLSDVSTSARTFAGGGLTYNDLTIGGATGISNTTLVGSNTFATLASTKTVAHTITFTAGTTTTVSAWTIRGTSGNIVTLASTTTSPYTLAKTGGSIVQMDYMSISYASGSAANTWYAGSNSTNGGNNTNIIFAYATLYWRGGSGTWNSSSTTNWSSSSGGTSDGILVPNQFTPVQFDAGSDVSAPFTVTVGAGAVCINMVVTGLDQGMTLAGSSDLGIYGSLTLPATNFSSTHSANINFLSTGSETITTNGSGLSSNLVFNSTGTWTLGSALTTTGTTTLTTGTLALSSFTYSTASFSSNNANSRTISFGTGKMVLTSASTTTIWDTTTVTGLTTSGTALVETTGGGATTKTISAGAMAEGTAVNFSILNTAGTVTFTASNTVNNLIINASGTTITNIALTIYGNYTYTAGTIGAGTNTWTFAATSGTKTVNTADTVHDFPITFNGTGGTFALGSNLTNITAGTTTKLVTLTAGTLNLSTFTLTCGQFSSSGSTARTLAFGTGKIVINAATAVTILDTGTITNLTVTGTRNIEFTGSSAVIRTVNTGALVEASSFNISVLTTGGTVTFTASNTINNFVLNAAGTTISNIAVTIYGDYTYTAATLTAGANAWTFAGSGTSSITSGGATHDFPITFNGTGTFTLSGNLTVGATRTTTLTTGTLTLGTAILSTGIFSSSNSNSRGVSATSGFIDITFATAATVFDTATVTNMTNTGNPVVRMPGAAAVIRTVNTGALSEANAFSFNITSTAGTVTFTASNTVRDLTISAAGTTISNIAITIFGNYTYSAGTLSAGANAWTFAATGSRTLNSGGATHDFPITFNGVGGTWTLTTNGLTVGATRTTTLTNGTLALGSLNLSTGIFSSSNSNTRSITSTGGQITITFATTATVFDTTTITGLTTSGNPQVEIVSSGTTITRTISAGALSEANAFKFSLTGTATTSTVTFTANNTMDNLTINTTGVTVTNVALIIYGNYTYTAGTMGAGANAWTFSGTGSQTINTGGLTHDFPMTVSAGVGTYTLAGALTLGATRTLTLTSGTFASSTFAVSVGLFSGTGTTTRTLNMGSGNWTLSGVGTVWDLTTTTNLTFTRGTSNITLSDVSTSARTFAGGSLTYNNLTIGGTTGISNTTLTGSNTFATLASTKTVAHTITFTAGTTTTVTSWTIKGTPGNIVTLASTTTAAYTLAKAGGSIVQMDYMSISYATGSTTNTWYAGINSTDGGNNTNIIFAYATLYWRGGSGTWNSSSTTNWSSSSGGTSDGILVPNQFTPVQFDAGSDVSATFTVTVGAGAVCSDMTVSGLDQSMVLAGSSDLGIYGSLALPSSNFSSTHSAAINFLSTASETISTNNVSLTSNIVFNGNAGTWTLGSAFTTTGTTTLTLGTMALGTFTYTTLTFASNNANVRSINFGTGKIVVTSSAATTIWDMATVTNFTKLGTQRVETTGGGATTKTINAGTPTEGNAITFVLLNTAGTVTFTAGNAISGLTISATGTTIANVAITIFGNYTYTAGTLTAGANAWTFAGTGTSTITGGSATHDFPITFNGTTTWTLASNFTVGDTRTTTLTAGTLALSTFTWSTGQFSSSGTGVRSITTSTGKFAITSTTTATVWDTTTQTSLTVTGNPTIELTGSAAVTRVVSLGALAEASAFDLDILTTGGTVSLITANTIRDLTINASGTVISNVAIVIYGNYTYTAGSLGIGSSAWTFAATSSKTISTGGTLHDFPITFNGTGGTWTLLSAFVSGSTRTTTLTAGTLALSTFNYTTGLFSSNVATTRAVTTSGGKMVINYSTAAGATVFTTATITGLTTTGNPVVEIANTAAQVCTINSGTLNEANAFSFLITATVGTTTFTASNTVSDLTISGAGNTISNIAITIYGDYTYTAGTLSAGANTWTFAGTGTELINTGSTTHDFPFTLNGTGATFRLTSSALTLGSTRLLTLTTGTFDPNNLAVSVGNYTQTGGTLGTNITTFTVVSAGNYTGGTYNTNGTHSYASFTQNGAATAVNLTNNTSFSVSGTYTLTAGTLSLSTKTLNVGQFSSSNTNARTIAFGTGKISVNSTTTSTVWDTGTVTGLTITGTPVADIIGSSVVTRTINSGALVEASSINFNLLTSAGTITFTANNTTRDLVINAAGTTISNIAIIIYGDYTYTAGTMTAGTSAWTFSGSDTETISTGGVLHDFPFTFNGIGSYTLGSNLVSGGTRTATLTAGTLVLGTFSFTTGLFSSANTNTRAVTASTGKIVLNYSTAAGATIFNTSTITGLTTSGNPTVEIANTAAQVCTINSGTLGASTAFSFLITATVGTTTFTAANTLWDLTINGPGNTVSNIAIVIYGSYSYSNGTLSAGANAWTFAATTSETISGGGTTHDFPITFNGAGGTWTFNSNFTIGATRTTTLTTGTININSRTVSTGIFSSSNSNARGVSATSGTISITFATAATVFDTATVTNMTNTGNPRITLGGSAAVVRIISAGALDENNAFSFNITATAGTTEFTNGNTVKNLTISGSGHEISNRSLTIYGNYSYTAGIIDPGPNTWTFGTTLSNTINSTTTQEFPITFNGVGGTWTLQNDFTVGSANITTLTAGTVTLNTHTLRTGIFNATGTTARTIAFGTTGNIAITGNGTTVWNSPTVTNLSVTGNENINLVYSGSSGTRTINHGATAGDESTALSFNIKAGTDSISITAGSDIDDLNFTGFGGFWNNSAMSIYGNLTIDPGMLPLAGTGAVTFESSSTAQTIISNDLTLDFPITKSGTQVLTITGNLNMGTTSTSVFTLTQGTLDLNNNWLKASRFSSSNSNTRSLIFGNTWIELFGNAGTVLNLGTVTNLTVTGSKLFRATYTGATGTRAFTMPLLNAGGSEANAMDLRILGGTDIVTVGGASAAAAGTMRNLDFSGFGGTWSQTSTGSRKIYGNLTLWPTMTISSSTLVTEFSASSGNTQIITSSDRTMDFPVTLNGTGNYLLYDPMKLGSTRALTLTTGNLDLNYNTANVGILSSSGSSARRIDFNGGAVVINGSATTVLSMATATNYSYTGFSNVWLNYDGATGTRTLDFGGTAGDTAANAPNVTVHGGSDAVSITTGTSFNDFYMSGGFSGSLQWVALTIHGNVAVPSTATVLSGNGAMTLASTANTKKVDFGNVLVDHPVIFNGAGGSWDLSSNLILGNARLFDLTAGNLNMNSKIITTGSVTVSGSTSRSLTFGTDGVGQIYVVGNGNTVWNGTTLTNMTISGDPVVNFDYAGAVGTRTITHGTTGGSEAVAITANITNGSDTVAITGHFKDLGYSDAAFAGTITYGGTVNVYGNLSLSSTTISDSGTQLLNLIPSSGTKTIRGNGATTDRPVTFNGTGTWNLQSNMVVGTTRVTTLTAGNLNLGSSTLTVGNLSSNGSSVRSIGFGTGKIVVTGVTNTVVGFATATNFTASGSKTVELPTAATTGTRTINFGATAGATESNSLSFNVQAGTDTVAITSGSSTMDLSFSGFSGTWTPATTTIYGNLRTSTGQTIGTSTSVVTMASTSGTKRIDTGDRTFDFPLVFNAPSTTYLVTGNFTMGSTGTSTLTFTAGNINMGSNQLIVPTSFSATGSAARNISSNDAIILSGSGTVWSAATATNLSVSGSGYFLLSSASAKTFAGGSNSYLGLIQAGAGLLTITGSNTFSDIANSALPAPVRFESGSTTTFTSGFNLRGAGSTKLVIDSTVPGTAATLSLASGTVRGQDLNLRDSTATGGAVWYAGQTSIDSGNNTGWIFTGVPLTIGRGIRVERGISIT